MTCKTLCSQKRKKQFALIDFCINNLLIISNINLDKLQNNILYVTTTYKYTLIDNCNNNCFFIELCDPITTQVNSVLNCFINTSHICNLIRGRRLHVSLAYRPRLLLRFFRNSHIVRHVINSSGLR